MNNKIYIRVLCMVMMVLPCISLAQASDNFETHSQEKMIPSDKGFVANYGFVAPGDWLTLDVLAESSCYEILDGRVVSSSPVGGWEGGSTRFFAIIPDSFAGEHTGSFRGHYSVDCGDGGDGGEPPEWSGKAEAAVLSIKVTKVPEYLYADATAWVPVSFTVMGMSSDVDIQNEAVDVTFILDGEERFTYTAKVAPGDGFLKYVKAKSFTAWVDIAQFASIDIAEDTTGNATFKVTASVKDNVTKEYASVKSDPKKDAKEAAVKIFGDKNVEVIEIGFDSNNPINQFHFNKVSTKQTLRRSDAAVQWLQTYHDGIKLDPPRDVTHIGTHEFNTSHDNTDEGMNLHMRYVGVSASSSGSHRKTGVVYGSGFGCTFGVSYGYKVPQVLGGTIRGMLLTKKEGKGTAYIAQGSVVKAVISGTTASSTGDVLGGASSTLKLGVGIYSLMNMSGWGLTANLVLRAADIYKLSLWVPARDKSLASVRFQSFVQNVPLGGTLEGNPPQLNGVKGAIISQETEVMSMNPFASHSGNIYEVGETWAYTVICDITLESSTMVGSEVSVDLIFTPPAGKTFASPGIIGVSAH